MIVQGQLVKVKWVGANRKTLEKHGHIYTKLYDEIEIPIEHLSDKSHVKVTIKCDWCNKEKSKRRTDIALNGNHFCNHKCYGNWLSNSPDAKHISESRITSVKTNCKLCNKEILKKFSEFKNHGDHYCSRSCVAKDRMTVNNPNPTKEKVKVNCEYCSIEFDVHESKSKKNKWNFCSRECYSNYRSEFITGENVYNYQDMSACCDNCNKETKVTKYYLENRKNVFCSQECYYEYRSIYYIGENHPQFGTVKTPDQIEQMRIITANRIANGDFPQTNTTIQIKIRGIVEELGMDFKEEIQFKYYVLDFCDKDNKMAIEIMGDFWHANPLKYTDYDSLHDIQKKDTKRDKSKKTYLKKYYNIDVLYLWEYDINNKIELCKELMKKYVKNNSLLEDYNSYNYSLIGGELVLNSTIINPFFMRANTINQTC